MVLSSCISGCKALGLACPRARNIACAPDYQAVSLKATTGMFSNQNLRELEFTQAKSGK